MESFFFSSLLSFLGKYLHLSLQIVVDRGKSEEDRKEWLRETKPICFREGTEERTLKSSAAPPLLRDDTMEILIILRLHPRLVLPCHWLAARRFLDSPNVCWFSVTFNQVRNDNDIYLLVFNAFYHFDIYISS